MSFTSVDFPEPETPVTTVITPNSIQFTFVIDGTTFNVTIYFITADGMAAFGDFIPSHGGNFAPLREAVGELGGQIEGTRIVALGDLGGFLEVIYASQLPFDVTPARAGPHAGTGLGLAIVKAVAEAHGGRVHAANVGTGGAVVSLVLPALAGDRPAPVVA